MEQTSTTRGAKRQVRSGRGFSFKVSAVELKEYHHHHHHHHHEVVP